MDALEPARLGMTLLRQIQEIDWVLFTIWEMDQVSMNL